MPGTVFCRILGGCLNTRIANTRIRYFVWLQSATILNSLLIVIAGSIAMKRLLHHLLLAIFAFLFLTPYLEPILSAGEPVGVLVGFAKKRAWTDSTGEHRVEASLKSATSEEVQLEQSNA